MKSLNKDTLSKLVILNTFLSVLLLVLTFEDMGDAVLENSELFIQTIFLALPFVILWTIHRTFFTKWDKEIAPVLQDLQVRLQKTSSKEPSSPPQAD